MEEGGDVSEVPRKEGGRKEGSSGPRKVRERVRMEEGGDVSCYQGRKEEVEGEETWLMLSKTCI